MILASIAQATPASKSFTPFAAVPKLPAPEDKSAVILPVVSKELRPTITPAIVPARPQYKGVGVSVLMSFSTESQCRSTASFKREKSMTEPELFSRYLLIESLMDSKTLLPRP